MFNMDIRDRSAQADRDIRDIPQQDGGRGREVAPYDVINVNTRDIHKDKCRPEILFLSPDVHIPEVYPPDVTDEESIGGHGAKHIRLGIVRLSLRGTERGVLCCPPTILQNLHVADSHLLDGTAGKAAEN